MTKFGEWIPVKWREMTEEEREYYPEGTTCISDFKLPDDGDEILISRNNGKWIELVEFCNDCDYGIGDENGNDWLTDVDAWMPLPKGYVKDEKEYCEHYGAKMDLEDIQK